MRGDHPLALPYYCQASRTSFAINDSFCVTFCFCASRALWGYYTPTPPNYLRYNSSFGAFLYTTCTCSELEPPSQNLHRGESSSCKFGGNEVSAEGWTCRTPAMRHLFAKRAHCKWHNLRHRRGAATMSLVPECRRCPPKWWVPFKGERFRGKPAGRG